MTLLAEVALSYVDARTFHQRIVYARGNAETQERALRLVRARYETGISPALDVAQAEYNLAVTEASIPLLEMAARWFASHVVDSLVADVAAYAMLACFFVYVTTRILRYVLTERRVTFETVSAALCAYLFLGFIWATIYAILESVQPGSLNLTLAETVSLFPSSIYYSFVTLMTLGYGDMTPRTMPAQYLSFVEAVLGQLYLAVLVVRLVGLHIARSMNEKC